MQFDPAKTMVHGLFGAGDVKHNALQLQQAYEQMKTIAAYGENNLYLVGLCFVKRSAMLSYPNYNGINKALDHPDISVLAALAELAGVDFRVLVLQREASEVLASTARRGIGGLEEPKILLDNAAALHAQLQLLDHRFFQCLHYQDMGNLTATQQSQLADFLHPTLIPPILGNNNMRPLCRLYVLSRNLLCAGRMLESVHYSSGSTHNDHLRKHSSPRRLSQQGGEDKNKKRYVLDAPSQQQHQQQQEAVEKQYEEESTRYHAWQLAQRIGLIERLCAAPVTAAAVVT